MVSSLQFAEQVEKPIGVQYAPASSRPSGILTLEDVRSLAIKYIRIQWVDLTNCIRCRILPTSYFLKVMSSPRPSVSIAKVTLGIVYLNIADGFGAVGEYLYVPDMSTLRYCTYSPGHASVMGFFKEKSPSPNVDKALDYQVDLCPRTILERIVSNAKETIGLDFLVGFETEFILLDSLTPPRGTDSQPWCSSAGFRTGTPSMLVLEEITDSLVDSGIEVQMLHKEAAPGQYEIVTGPLAPLQAADALIHTRETIYNIAKKHKLHATLAPRVFLDTCGSGAHTHISVHSSGDSPTSKTAPNLTDIEASFLAYVLEHLPSLVALTLPTPASFKRMVDGAWSGGTYVCWGTDNKEAPVRLCNATSPTSRNFELKTVDGTANPYLVLAGVLGAGIEGVRKKSDLKAKDHVGTKLPVNMEDSERAELGITTRLPLKWDDARKSFEESELIHQLFGSNFVTKYLSVQKTLADSLVAATEEESLTRLVEFY